MKTELSFLLSVLLAAPLFAAGAEKPARRPGADAPGRPQAGLVSPPGGAAGFERVLTDEQRRKLREYNQANGEKTRASQQEAMKLRRELQEAVVNGKADEAAIKEKSEAISKLEAEVLAARMSAMAKIAATLTPEQKEKIKEMSEQVRPARRGLDGGPRNANAPRPPREPAAPPPPDK